MRQPVRRSPVQRSSALLLLALVLSAGCHRASEDSDRTPAPAAQINEVPLEVVNHHWLDVTIYVVRDGQPARVGIANATSSASFVLPSRLLGQGGEVRLLGRPIGGSEGAVSETVVVQPGQLIEWTLESDLSRSTIGVY
jgi:hypothetical protein